MDSNDSLILIIVWVDIVLFVGFLRVLWWFKCRAAKDKECRDNVR